MGQIKSMIKIVNHKDEILAGEGHLDPSKIRSVETEAVADSGATRLCLKQSIIQQLGLPLLGERKARTTNGIVTRKLYGDAHIFLMGRDTTVDVSDIPDDCPNLLGQIPLEVMDFVLDLKGQKIIPNPEHGGEWQTEEY
jgi:predicted aspartyl protease